MRATRICGTVGNLLGVLLARQLLTTKQCGHSAAAEDLGDASLLLHTFLRVRGGLAEPPAHKRFGELVKEMRHLWKEHWREEVRRLDPGREEQWNETRLRRTEEREPPTPPTPSPRRARPVPEELSEDQRRAQELAEREKIMKEMQRAKYGEEMRLVVRDPLGREVSIKFHDLTHLRVLIYSVCRRLALLENETHFFYEEREIFPDDTAQSVGLVDQDVIEVKSEVLDRAYMRMLREREDTARAEMKAAQAAQEDLFAKRAQREPRQTEGKKQMERQQAKIDEQVAKVQAKANRDKAGFIDLQFMDLEGKLTRTSVRREVWLGGPMNRICKKLNLDPLTTCFFIEVTHAQIVAHDSAESLGLDQDEIIRLKPCEETADDEAPWS